MDNVKKPSQRLGEYALAEIDTCIISTTSYLLEAWRLVSLKLETWLWSRSTFKTMIAERNCTKAMPELLFEYVSQSEMIMKRTTINEITVVSNLYFQKTFLWLVVLK